jgi:catechol 2,3-dioxygenase-like lactoylglutathione lyase family enzyme
VVADPAASRDFWVDVVGAELYGKYGGMSAVLKFADTQGCRRALSYRAASASWLEVAGRPDPRRPATESLLAVRAPAPGTRARR